MDATQSEPRQLQHSADSAVPPETASTAAAAGAVSEVPATKQAPPLTTKLELLGQKPAGKIKTSHIKHAWKAAGKRPSEVQAAQLVGFLEDRPDTASIVYDLLSEIETSSSGTRLSPLKPGLWQIVSRWYSQPAPLDVQTAREWIRSEAQIHPIPANRLQALVLWLLSQHRSPETFAQCLMELGSAVQRKKPKKQVQPQNGFVMAPLAKSIAGIARGLHPKPGKLTEIGQILSIAFGHLYDKSREADEALKQKDELTGALAEQKRINEAQAASLATLEQNAKELQRQKTQLEEELRKASELHQQAIDSAAAQVAEAKKAVVTKLRAAISPKVTDARLYLDRPNPSAAQGLRLLGEIEKTLTTEANV